MFRIGDGGASAVPFTNVITAPCSYRTKASYHNFWDTHICKFLEALILEGDADRNSNRHPETRKARPDFGFLINKRCVFRGEEKGPMSGGDPAAELIQKLKWTYDSAPYILGTWLSSCPELCMLMVYTGYYADETKVTFVAIVHTNGETRRIDLESINLKRTVDRILNVRRLINICSILRQLANMIHQPTPEFLFLQRYVLMAL